jgi:hypothetical protein
MASQSAFSIFNDYFPAELTLMVAGFLQPVDVCNFSLTCKKHHKLITENIKKFVRLYIKTTPLEIERFMWNQFFNEDLTVHKIKLFFNMSSVYHFPKTNELELSWKENQMDDNEDYGELPEDEKDLYVVKFQASMLCRLAKRMDIFLACLLSYSSKNLIYFEFLFKFLIKYRHLSSMVMETIESDIEVLIDKKITFEQFNGHMNDALLIGGRDTHIYLSLTNDDSTIFTNYMKLLSAGVDSTTAFNDSERYISSVYLEKYKSLKPVIGHNYAYHYIIQKSMLFTNDPEIVQNLATLYANDINDISIANRHLTSLDDEILAKLCADKRWSEFRSTVGSIVGFSVFQ